MATMSERVTGSAQLKKIVWKVTGPYGIRRHVLKYALKYENRNNLIISALVK